MPNCTEPTEIKLSIVSVVYNNHDDMEKFLDFYSQISCRQDVELIIVDGGSNDGTVDLIHSRSDIIDRYISESDAGIYDAMNKGIKMSSGVYIALINSDDWIIPDNFRLALDALTFSTADILACGARMVRNGQFAFNRWPRSLDLSVYVRTIPFSHNAIFIARSLYDQLGLYRTDLKIVSDLEFYYRAASVGARVDIFDKLIIESELTGLSGQDSKTLNRENIQILQEQLPFLSLNETEALVDFRKSLTNADTNFKLQRLFFPIERGIEHSVDLAAMFKMAIDSLPKNLLGERFDHLLALLPRSVAEKRYLELGAGTTNDHVMLTIGVPTFNCEDTIRRTIASLCAQTLPNTEILIFDDGSTDGTLNILQSLDASNIRIFRSIHNIGVAAIRNQIAKEARGDYVMFCDDDDVSHPERAARCMEKLREVENQTGRYGEVVCFTTRELVTTSGNRFEVAAAGSEAPLTGINLRQTILGNLARVAGETGTLGTLDISIPRAVGCGVGLYSTKLLRELCFHETFRRLEDLEFCMAAAEKIVVTGVREVLYTQYMTLSQDKGNDSTAAFSVLLLRFYHYQFVNLGVDPNRLAKKYIDIAETPLKQRLQVMLRIPPFLSSSPSVTTLCTWDRGGAGLGTHRRIEAMHKHGVDNTFYCLFKTTKKDYVRRFPVAEGCGKNKVLTDYWQSKATLPQDPSRGHQSRELFSTTWSMTDFRRDADQVKNGEILHLHWVVGMLDYDNMGDVLANHPVVWTLADMNAFTGGCHYSEGCEGYKNECQDCPLLGNEVKDLAHHAWKKKKQAYTKLNNLHIICPSQWLADCAQSSSLLGDRPVHMIPNAFPVDRFTPTNKTVARLRLGLPLDKKLVVFGADSLKNRRKGGDILTHSIHHLRGMGKVEGLEGVFFGSASLDLGMKGHNMGIVTDEVKLSMIYAAADVFAFPSREDNAPLTVVESLLSGTPVVAFPVGNVPELICHKDTGYIARYEDAEDFAKGLLWVLDCHRTAEGTLRGLRGHLAAKRHNDPGLSVERHLKIYNAMLESD